MKVPYTNDSNKHVHIGPVTIAPGMTRDVEDSHIPGYKNEAKKLEQNGNPDTLAELLKGSIKDIVPALNGMLLADIERLGELEQKGQNRKGVLGAIAEIQLKAGADAELLAKVEAFSDEELKAALEDAKTDINVDPDYLAALEAEAGKRNPEEPV